MPVVLLDILMKDLIVAGKYKLNGDHLSVTVTEKSERIDEETKEVKVSWVILSITDLQKKL
ncbi:hypothetical protein [Terribacillus saccharophilus]|uniref:hypothetical protein n=1 Tax=Terribacillus saccharophilus TaxID=361277 RepID=UPI001140BB85|nr:hypothetical protein [Terribacillus saccharophilus]